MRKIKKLFWVILFLTPLTCWSATIVSFDIPDPLVSRGETFNVDIIANIPNTGPVLGWGLDIDFDETLLSLEGVAVSSLWSTPASNPDGDGLVGLFFSLTPPLGVSGDDILLATLTFEASSLIGGFSDLTASFSPGDLTEGFPLAPPAAPGSFSDVVFVPDVIQVSEPNTTLLLIFFVFILLIWNSLGHIKFRPLTGALKDFDENPF